MSPTPRRSTRIRHVVWDAMSPMTSWPTRSDMPSSRTPRSSRLGRNSWQPGIAALADLSPDDFELLVFVAWEQLSSREVAAILDIPPSTVRSRMHCIRQQLDTTRASQPEVPGESAATSPAVIGTSSSSDAPQPIGNLS